MHNFTRTKRNVLFTLTTHDNIIFAISDSLREIEQYYLQFKSCFDNLPGEVSIHSIVSEKEICNLSDKFKDTLWLYWLTDEIVLTNIECDYYSKYLLKMYEDTKNMMSQMILLNQFSNFSPSDKKTIMDAFDTTYKYIKSFDDFIHSIDSKEFFQRYIMNPDVCKEMIQLDEIMNEKMHS